MCETQLVSGQHILLCLTHLSCCSYAYLAQASLLAVPEVHQDHDGRGVNTAQHSTAQHSTAWHSTAQLSTAQHSVLKQPSVVIISTALCCLPPCTLQLQLLMRCCAHRHAPGTLQPDLAEDMGLSPKEITLVMTDVQASSKLWEW